MYSTTCSFLILHNSLDCFIFSLFCDQCAICGQVKNHCDKTSKFLFYIMFDDLLFKKSEKEFAWEVV